MNPFENLRYYTARADELEGIIKTLSIDEANSQEHGLSRFCSIQDILYARNFFPNQIHSMEPVAIKLNDKEQKEVQISPVKKVGCGYAQHRDLGKKGLKYLQQITYEERLSSQPKNEAVPEQNDFDDAKTQIFQFKRIIKSPEELNRMSELLDLENVPSDLAFAFYSMPNCIVDKMLSNGWVAYAQFERRKKEDSDLITFIPASMANQNRYLYGLWDDNPEGLDVKLLNLSGGIKDAGNGVGVVNLEQMPIYLKNRLLAKQD